MTFGIIHTVTYRIVEQHGNLAGCRGDGLRFSGTGG